MDLRECSKKAYLATNNSPSFQDVQTGALMRIADATEKMAQNVTRLQDERDKFRLLYNDARRERDYITRQRTAYRGVITKLKRRLADAEGGR